MRQFASGIAIAGALALAFAAPGWTQTPMTPAARPNDAPVNSTTNPPANNPPAAPTAAAPATPPPAASNAANPPQPPANPPASAAATPQPKKPVVRRAWRGHPNVDTDAMANQLNATELSHLGGWAAAPQAQPGYPPPPPGWYPPRPPWFPPPWYAPRPY
jgi:hypothetical protein